MLQGLWVSSLNTEVEGNAGLEKTWLCARGLLVKLHVRTQEPYVWEGEIQQVGILGEWVCGFQKVYVLFQSMSVLKSYSSGYILHTTMQPNVAFVISG